MPGDFRWERGIRISGFGQFKDFLFETKDRNADLVDEFFRRSGLQDQYWISISFPSQWDKPWDQDTIQRLEREIREDFEYDGYTAILDLEHGEYFPRSVPLIWFMSLSEDEEVEA